MKQKIEKEYTLPLDEYGKNTKDYEFSPLPDEFLQGTKEQEIEEAENKKRYIRKSFFSAVSMVLVMIILFNIGVKGENTNNNENKITDIATSEKADNTISETKPAGEPATNPSENPAAEQKYPLSNGKVHIVVYNDSFNTDTENFNNYNLILADVTYDEEYFANGEVYEMPPYVEVSYIGVESDFVFMDWVAYISNRKKGVAPVVEVVGNSINAAVLEKIKPNDGVREVAVHAAWRTKEAATQSNMAMMLVLDGNGGTIEGKNSVIYNAGAPLGSAAYVYPCAYPVPVREGYSFTGWYEKKNDNTAPVGDISAGTFFECDDTGEILWNNGKTVTLYAGWEKD